MQIQSLARQTRAKLGPRVALSDPPRMLTIREFAPQFLELAQARQAPRTFHETQRLTGILVECLGDVVVGSLTPLHVQALLHQIGVLERAPIQANRLRSVVSQLCQAAELHGLRALGTSPTRVVRPYPEQRRTDYVPVHLRGRFVEVCQRLAATREITVAAAALLQLMLLMGLRWSCARLLRWDEVVAGRGGRLELRLHPRGPRRPLSKGGARRIPLSPRAAQLIRSMPQTGPWWAPNPLTSKPYTEIRKQRAKVCAASGIEDTGYHLYRHTVGTAGGEAGLSMAQIAALLGHRDPFSAARYVHVEGEPAAAAAAAMDMALLGGADDGGDGSTTHGQAGAAGSVAGGPSGRWAGGDRRLDASGRDGAPRVGDGLELRSARGTTTWVRGGGVT